MTGEGQERPCGHNPLLSGVCVCVLCDTLLVVSVGPVIPGDGCLVLELASDLKVEKKNELNK